MVKSELITALGQRFPQLTRADVDAATSEILGAISRSLVNGDRVEIRSFGTFELNYRPARIGRNPMTGQRVEIPATRRPHFRPAKLLRELVDL